MQDTKSIMNWLFHFGRQLHGVAMGTHGPCLALHSLVRSKHASISQSTQQSSIMPSHAKTVACRVYTWSALNFTTFVQAKCLQAVQGGPKTYSGGHWLGRQRNRHWEGQHCHQLWHARDRWEAWQWRRHILAQSAYLLFAYSAEMSCKIIRVRMGWSSISCSTCGSPNETFGCSQRCYSGCLPRGGESQGKNCGTRRHGHARWLSCTHLYCSQILLANLQMLTLQTSWKSFLMWLWRYRVFFQLKWQYDHRS